MTTRLAEMSASHLDGKRSQARRRPDPPRSPSLGSPPSPHAADGLGESARRLLRLKVWCRRAKLDRELACGADPASRPDLQLEASHLLRPRSRRFVADALAALVPEPRSTSATLSARPPVRSDQVRPTAPVIDAVVRRLRSPSAVSPQGLALARRLLCDPAGPLYAPSDRDQLNRAMHAVLEALEPRCAS